MNKSQMTSISFTVDDDLISESSLNSTIRSKNPNGVHPFAKQYGIPVTNQKLKKKLKDQAQNDAYKQLNEQLFNPFEHKLGSNFVPGQQNFYEQEKKKQLQMLKKKQQQAMTNNRNYTIVFHNNAPKKNVLQTAGKNLVNNEDGNAPKISDYYNKKFVKNKEVSPIDQEDNDDEVPIKQSRKKISEEKSDENDKKVNNFVKNGGKNKAGSFKSIKSDKSTQNQQKKPQFHKRNSEHIRGVSRDKNSIEKPAERGTEEKVTIAKNLSKHDISSEDSLDNLDHFTHKMPKKVQQYKEVPQKVPPSPHRKQIPQNYKPKPNRNQQQFKKQIPQRKPQVPKAPKPNNHSKNLKGNNPNQKKKYADVYEGPDRNLVEQLERQLTQCPTISFDDIAELDTAKNLLQEAVLLPRLMPQFFQGIRRATKGILLFGPPGTGKTLLAKAIAKDNIFLNVSASSLASKWKGQSEKMVRLLFQIAKYYSPSVIFFDEIDAIGSKRSSNEHQSNRKVKTQLLVQMDGVGSEDNQIVVLAATNRPWDLDQALRRRLEKRIYIPLPEEQGRRKMFDINLKDLKISQKIKWTKLIQVTKGCSGADICNICRDAAYMPMRRKIQQVGGIQKLQQIKQEELIEEQVTEADLLESAKKVKPSVGKEDLKRYQAWMAQFGSS